MNRRRRENVQFLIIRALWMATGAVVALAAVILTGCATIDLTVGADEFGNPYVTQRVRGFGSATIEAASQGIDGTLHVPKGNGDFLHITIKTTQQAEGLEASGLEEITAGIISGVIDGLKPTP